MTKKPDPAPPPPPIYIHDNIATAVNLADVFSDKAFEVFPPIIRLENETPLKLEELAEAATKMSYSALEIARLMEEVARELSRMEREKTATTEPPQMVGGQYVHKIGPPPKIKIADAGDSCPIFKKVGFNGTEITTKGWEPNRRVLNAGQAFTIIGVHQHSYNPTTPPPPLQIFITMTDVTSDENGWAVIRISPVIETRTIPGYVFPTVNQPPLENAVINVLKAVKEADDG